MGNDSDIIVAKLEVCGGDEEGRTLLNRLDLNDQSKSFWATRLFLKAIGEECRGEFIIDSDNWVGRQFFATVVHNIANNGKTYANIAEYNFEKVLEQPELVADAVTGKKEEEKAWDE